MRSQWMTVPLSLLLAVAVWADQPELKTTDRPLKASHGTSIEFVGSPIEAAKLAKQEKKLVLILHVSGYFEDSDFT